MKARLLAVIVMLVALAVAFALDDWVVSAQRLAARTFSQTDYQLAFWGNGLANLVLAALLVTLTWVAFLPAGRSKWLGLVFIVFGLPPAFAVALWATLTSITWPIDPTVVIAPASRFSMAGAVIAAVRLGCLLLPPVRTSKEAASNAS
jgi:hypothetical protein